MYQKWKEITGLFKGFDCYTSADSHLIGDLIETRHRLEQMKAELPSITPGSKEYFAYQRCINQTLGVVASMEKSLFLDAAVRLKSLPKPEEPEEPDDFEYLFGAG